MKSAGISLLFITCAIFAPQASAVTATYTDSNQTITLTGLGGTNGVGQSRVDWGTCAFDGTNTNCTVTAPYTGVGGGGTISLVLSYAGNGTSPFLANSISAGSDLVTFGLTPGSSGTIVVSLQENSGQNVTFLSNNFTFFFSNATCTGVAAGVCSVGQVGLVPNATITGPIHGTFDATPSIGAVITASSYGGAAAVAPATWMEIYGTNLANVLSQIWSGDDFNGNFAPTALAGTTVTIGGQLAFIDYVSPLQVNAQVPSNISTGTQPVVVNTPGGESVAFDITVNATEPGLLAPASFNLPAGQYAGALAANLTTFILPVNAIVGVTSAPARPNDTIVFYGIGFGPVNPDIPAGEIVGVENHLSGDLQFTIGGSPAHVDFAGLTGGFLGLYQFNVVVPNVAAGDAVPVTYTLNGLPGTQTLFVAITQ